MSFRTLATLSALAFLGLTLARMDDYLPTPSQVHVVTLACLMVALCAVSHVVDLATKRVGGLTFFRVGRLWGGHGVSLGLDTLPRDSGLL